MAPEPTLEMIGTLEASRQDLHAAAAVPESQARINPEAGRWSVIDCVEHVVLAEERFLGWLEKGNEVETARANPQKEAELAVAVTNRASRAQAPEAAQPKGRFGSLAEALAAFDAVRNRSVQFVQQRGSKLYQLMAEHPRFGPMNGAEFVQIIAGHARRHAAQIREVRASLAAK